MPFRDWPRRRRIATLAAGLAGCLLAAGAAVVLAVAEGAGDLTHESPFRVLYDLGTGGRGSSIAQAADAEKPITIAVFGYGGEGHDGPFLTDSMMLVVIRPHHGRAPQIAEVSVPRDWAVPVDLGGGHVVWQKLNQAYADAAENVYTNREARYRRDDGPAALADDTLDHVLGVHVDHHVGVDFHAFQYAVDALGGIEVTVRTAFTDTQYPRGECGPGGDCGLTTFHVDAGPQHMDGAQALRFARSRHGDNGEGSDFARSRRQQLLMAAIRDRAESVGGISHIGELLSALRGHIDTDLTVGDMLKLNDLVKRTPASHIEHVSIDDTNFLYPCGYPAHCDSYYLYARDATYASIHSFMGNVIADSRALAERAPIRVVDASGEGDGASARWASLLRMQGFSATDGGTAAAQTATTVTGPLTGRGSLTAQLAAVELGTPVEPPAADSPGFRPPAASEPVVITLGTDEELAFNHAGVQNGVSTGLEPPASPGAAAAGNPVPATPSPTPKACAVAAAAAPDMVLVDLPISPTPPPTPSPAPTPTPAAPRRAAPAPTPHC